MVEKITYVYKTVGDLKIHADVFRKENGQRQPAMVYIHGGCLMYGSRTQIGQKEVESYTNAGFTVISIDYRLAPETKIKYIIEDLKDVFKWVAEEGPKLFNIDPAKIVTVGHSAGGYLTLMSGFAVTPKPVAIVAWYGYGDIDGAWYAEPDDFYNQQPKVAWEDSMTGVMEFPITETTNNYPAGRGGLYLYCRQNGLWPVKVTGFDPKREPRAFDEYCPVRNVTKDYSPTVLIHGDVDTDVPFQQSVDMDAELTRVGVDHEFLAYAGAGHGIGAKYFDDAIEKLLAFVKKYV